MQSTRIEVLIRVLLVRLSSMHYKLSYPASSPPDSTVQYLLPILLMGGNDTFCRAKRFDARALHPRSTLTPNNRCTRCYRHSQLQNNIPASINHSTSTFCRNGTYSPFAGYLTWLFSRVTIIRKGRRTPREAPAKDSHSLMPTNTL